MSFTKIKWALKQDGLLASEFRVLLILTDHCNEKSGKCFPSIRTVAGRAELSERHCKRVIKQLEAKGLIAVHRRFDKEGDAPRAHNSYVFRFVDEVTDTATGGDTNVQQRRRAGPSDRTSTSKEGDMNGPVTRNEPRIEPSGSDRATTGNLIIEPPGIVHTKAARGGWKERT